MASYREDMEARIRSMESAKLDTFDELQAFVSLERSELTRIHETARKGGYEDVGEHLEGVLCDLGRVHRFLSEAPRVEGGEARLSWLERLWDELPPSEACGGVEASARTYVHWIVTGLMIPLLQASIDRIIGREPSPPAVDPRVTDICHGNITVSPVPPLYQPWLC